MIALTIVPTDDLKKSKRILLKTLRILAKILAGIVILLLLVILFVRSPWGQGIIKDKFISSITDKTNTVIELDKLFITFSGDISVQGLYVEDKEGDTLVYSRSLEADIPLWPIINGNGIAVDELDWDGIRANITRKDSIEGFNFQFLVDAMMPADTTTTATTAQQDTTATQEFSIGDVNLSNFYVTYKDDVTGMDTWLKMKSLEVEMQETDLENIRFEVASARLSDTDFNYLQTKPFPESPEQEDAPLPYLSVNLLTIDNVNGEYESIPDGILARFDIAELNTSAPVMDLANNIIEVDNLDLNNSIVYMEMSPTEIKTTDSTEVATPAAEEGFQWPEWTVEVAEINLQSNDITYLANNARPKTGEFNPEALVLQELTLEVRDLYLKNKTAGADFNQLEFQESSGIAFNELEFNLDVSESALELSGLNFAANGNILKGELSAEYSSLDNFLNAPESAQLSADLSRFEIALQEIFRFQPDLRSNEYLVNLSRKKITGNLRIDGPVAYLQIPSATVNWGQNTRISARGSIQNPTEPDEIKFDFPSIELVSTKSDLNQIIEEDSLGISLPERVRLTGNLRGSPENINAIAQLNTSDGNINLNGSFINREEIAFDADMEIDSLQLGDILQNESLGALTLQLKASGEGSNLNTMDATLESTITSFSYNDYTIEGLEISGEVEDGRGMITSSYNDDNLNANLRTRLVLDSVAPVYDLSLNVEGADLAGLGFSTREIRTAFRLRAIYEGSGDAFQVTSSIKDGVAVYDDKSYLLGDFGAGAYVSQDSTAAAVDNKMLNLQMESNTSPAEFTDAIMRHYRSYLSDNVEPADTIENPANLKLRGMIAPAPILREVFLVDLEEMDTINLSVDFNEEERTLLANVSLPYVNYAGAEVDSLAFDLDSNPANFDFTLGFNTLSYGPLAIMETNLVGRVEQETLFLDFQAFYEEEQLVHIQSETTSSNDTLRIHLNPEDVVLNKNQWSIPQDNEALFADNSIDFNNFVFSRNDQEFSIRTDLPNVETEHLGFTFENFNLAALLSYLNPEETLATGRMNGDLILEEPTGSTGILADMDINEFNLMEVNMGTLSLDGESLGNQNYDFGLATTGGEVIMDLTGNYQVIDTVAQIDMVLNLEEVQMSALSGFSMGAISSGEGTMSGEVQLNGTTANPQYEGNLDFNEATFTVAMLDAPFTMPNENLTFDNQGFYFENFVIEDAQDNSFVVDGEVNTESFLNPSFDLTFNAENFQVLNSTAEDNDLFYGTASFDVDATLTGDLNLPILDMDLDIGPNTDVTYVIPENEVDIQERGGIVIFVNRENPDAILTQTDEEDETIILSGFDISALISIDEDAVFNIIISEDTGDNFRVTGEGDLNFHMYPNGRTTLAGRYEMSGGHYEMSLYNLVSRRFEIAEGSSVSWSGDPMDANMDIRAIYRIETSASSLMAAQTSGADVSTQNRFRQELPFLVYLNVDGELMQPEISFGLDMPEEEQGAVSGQVYGRVQQLNNQEQELNKQVFSLLVLNRFYPDSGTDGSGGGTATIARDNLNQALSDQLNMFSNKLLGDSGVQLDFGLDSYTDYQGANPQNRTELDIAAQKSFMNDRLIVRVGSEVDIEGSSSDPAETNPLIGNVSLQYLISEDGTWRLKGFRLNQFENVIDGQVIVSGLALIFTKEFNKFQELWAAMLNNEEEEEEDNQNQEDEN
ncbi:translocation/assembly module TamB domain-containing protein [Salegentibacter sp. F188]|uniref:Translocation/assembly module TamB domain-containing protein n=1 Tax=Autumnicola patrickiae TaxID=3075591 RepID=A0ABU3E2F3_9FLAO|nr:translocation/assembly module TamB domain-containing protein [Salegentibacter sp. F188]MDT0690136.1 translocation/assembly module TamB domain-containing protein [Salegentibacter sp. F188]